MNIFVCGYSFAGLVSIKSWLEYMLQASGKSAWNLRNNRKTPNYWRILPWCVSDSYDNQFTVKTGQALPI